jgi:hypothetical protein
MTAWLGAWGAGAGFESRQGHFFRLFQRGNANPLSAGGRTGGSRRRVPPMDWDSFIKGALSGGTVVGVAAYALGRSMLKGVERLAKDKYEDKRKLVEGNRKVLEDARDILSQWLISQHEVRTGQNKQWASMNADNARERIIMLQHQTGNDEVEARIAYLLKGASEHNIDELRALISEVLRRL